MKDIKVGDVVHVKGVAAYQSVGGVGNNSEGVWLVEFGYGTRAAIPPADILHVEPRPLQVGGKVRWRNCIRFAGEEPASEIRGIVDGDIAVVRTPVGYRAVRLCELERAE